jgi:hypothetical protein
MPLSHLYSFSDIKFQKKPLDPSFPKGEVPSPPLWQRGVRGGISSVNELSKKIPWNYRGGEIVDIEKEKKGLVGKANVGWP